MPVDVLAHDGVEGLLEVEEEDRPRALPLVVALHEDLHGRREQRRLAALDRTTLRWPNGVAIDRPHRLSNASGVELGEVVGDQDAPA
eukprot:9179683-Lingulodinium_polyedra.AAC.1